MSAGIAIDVSEFQAALKEYLSATSKTLPVAINGKAKDLALRAASNTPKSTMHEQAFRRQQKSRPLIAYRARKRYGDKFSADEFAQVRDQMALQRLGKGFMRSAWVNAASKFKKTQDASTAKPVVVYKFANSKATAQKASETVLRAAFDCSWQAASPHDQKGKQAIADNAIRPAIQYVTNDMRNYLLRKYQERARKASASVAKAVGKVFS